MNIFVKVKLRARASRVEKLDDVHYCVSVNAIASEGRANLALIRALADYFDIAPSRISILTGQKSRQKIVEIN